MRQADKLLGANIFPDTDMETYLSEMARHYGIEEDPIPEWQRVADLPENKLAAETLEDIAIMLKEQSPCEEWGCNDHDALCKIPATHTLKWVLRMITRRYSTVSGEIKEVTG